MLSGLAARCNFGTLEDQNLRDVFIVIMNHREAQNELCRSTKTPEEVYKIFLSYEGGDNHAILCVSTITGGGNSSAITKGGLHVKTEPVRIIRGGYRNTRSRGRGHHPDSPIDAPNSRSRELNCLCGSTGRPHAYG